MQKQYKCDIIQSHGAVQVSTGILEYKWQAGGTRYVQTKNNWKQKSISFRLIEKYEAASFISFLRE